MRTQKTGSIGFYYSTISACKYFHSTFRWRCCKDVFLSLETRYIKVLFILLEFSDSMSLLLVVNSLRSRSSSKIYSYRKNDSTLWPLYSEQTFLTKYQIKTYPSAGRLRIKLQRIASGTKSTGTNTISNTRRCFLHLVSTRLLFFRKTRRWNGRRYRVAIHRVPGIIHRARFFAGGTRTTATRRDIPRECLQTDRTESWQRFRGKIQVVLWPRDLLAPRPTIDSRVSLATYRNSNGENPARNELEEHLDHHGPSFTVDPFIFLRLRGWIKAFRETE